MLFQLCFRCYIKLIVCLHRYFSAAHLILARVLKCKLNTFVYSISLYYGTLIDILIGLYRIAIFDQKCSIIKNSTWFKILIVAFMFSVLVNLPQAFFKVRNDQELIWTIFNSCEMEIYFIKLYGPYLILLSTFIQNVLTFIMEVIINVND